LVDNGAGDNGSIDDLPWASVFDPAANARALSAIQAEGFRAASQIVDRFARIAGAADGADGDPASSSARANGSNAGRTVISDLEQITRSWWSLVGQTLLRSAPAAAAQGGTSTLDLANAEASGQVTLEADGTGLASGEVWLHNRGPEDYGRVPLRCSDLLSHDGHLISSAAVEFDPDVAEMRARSSRGVAVTVHVEHVRSDLYRGTLLAVGHPNLWLPVVLIVRAPAT